MIQIDFWTQITMLSSWPGHVSVSGRSEWKAQSVCVIEARLTHLQRGMLITRAWPGPLWAVRDKKNQFLSCQTLPAPDLRDLLSWRLVFSPGSRRSRSGRRLSFWEKKARRTAQRQRGAAQGGRLSLEASVRLSWSETHWISWADLIGGGRNEILAALLSALTAEQVNRVGRQAMG